MKEFLIPYLLTEIQLNNNRTFYETLDKTWLLQPIEDLGYRKEGKEYQDDHVEKLLKALLSKRFAIIEWDIAKIPIGKDAKDWYAIVDKEFSWLDEYSRNWNGKYPVAYIGGKQTYLHWKIIGKPPRWLITDHINRDTRNNIKENLRHTSHEENSLNRAIHNDNKSWRTGVFYIEKSKRWCAQYTKNGVLAARSYHNSFEEAVSRWQENNSI